MRSALAHKRILWNLVVLLFSMIAAHTSLAQCANTITTSGYVQCMVSLDGGIVEQDVWIFSSSDNTEIDAFADASYAFYQSGEVEEMMEVDGWINTGPHVTAGPTSDWTTGTPMTASTTVGTTYTAYGKLTLCLGQPYQGPSGPGGGDGGNCNPDDVTCGCDPYARTCNCDPALYFCGASGAATPDFSLPPDFAGSCTNSGGTLAVVNIISVSITTGVPQISTLSPSSNIQGVSNQQLTVTGSNLVDSFGKSTVLFHGASGGGIDPDMSGTVTNANPNSSGTVNVTYTISPTAQIGTHNVSIKTGFGESDYKAFTVGYPPAANVTILPQPWVAGWVAVPVTISGTGFGTAPTVNVTDPAGRVTATPAYDTSPDGTTTHINVSVDPAAPTEGAVVTVLPSYTGNGYTCGGTGCASNPTGSSVGAAAVQSVTPTPVILRITDSSQLGQCSGSATLSGTAGETDVFAGEQVWLCVQAPPNGFTIMKQEWNFENLADITGGFTDCPSLSPAAQCESTGGSPSVSTGGSEAADPTLTQSSTNPPLAVKFYFLNPSSTETARYHWTLSNGDTVGAETTADFNIIGPTGNLFPQAMMLTTLDATGNSLGVQVYPFDNGSVVQARLGPTGTEVSADDPNGATKGILFKAQAAFPTTPNSNGTYAKQAFTWIQMINSASEGALVRNAGPLNRTYTPNALDGSYPYADHLQSPTSEVDTPSLRPPPAWGEAYEQFDATMYLMWDPGIAPQGQDCHVASVQQPNIQGPWQPITSTCTLSTPIPLGSIRWSYSGCAINTLVLQSLTGIKWIRDCGKNMLYAAGYSGYPTWSVTDKPIVPIGP